MTHAGQPTIVPFHLHQSVAKLLEHIIHSNIMSHLKQL